MAVVVIGAGIAGLTAALTVADAGVDVVVLDAADRPGGMLRTSTFAGRRVDEGADAFLVRTPTVLDLADRVGLTDLIHPRRREARIWHSGRSYPMAPHVMGVPLDVDAVAATGLLSPDGVARLRRDLTDAATPLPDGDVTVAEAIGGRLGDEAMHRLVDPLVAGINAGDTAEQSLAAVVPQLDAARRDPHTPSLIEACRRIAASARASGPADAPIFAAPADGIDRLPARVAAAAVATGRVTIRCGAAVAALEPGRVHLADGEPLDAEATILAVPGHRAADLLSGTAPTVARLLADVDHASVAFVRLALAPHQADIPESASGVLVPRGQGLDVTACSFTSNKWERLDPARGDGTVIVRAALGHAGGRDVTDDDDAAIVERTVEDLGGVIALSGAPAAASVHRWRRAFPQYRPGHLDRVAAVEAALAVASPDVSLAGMYLRGVGIPAAVTSGRAAAANAIGHLG